MRPSFRIDDFVSIILSHTTLNDCFSLSTLKGNIYLYLYISYQLDKKK